MEILQYPVALLVGGLLLSSVLLPTAYYRAKGMLNSVLLLTTTTPTYRLPGDVTPHHYNLSLLIDLEAFTSKGTVDIKVECKAPTDTITLHSYALKIAYGDVTLVSGTGTESLVVSGVSIEPANDFLKFKLVKPLVAGGVYILHIPFTGTIDEGLMGLYRSSYVEKATDTTKWLAATQFEPTGARRAFPCFDEPAMKARFSIRLGHRPGLSSASNMPQSTNLHTSDGWEWNEFQESKPMSTYVVAFMVSDLVYRESTPEPNKVKFRVWARKEALSQVEFSLQYGPKFLNYLEEFFEVLYPLPKVDLVALPDFAAGAMENWGFITFRETSLLVDNQATSQVAQHYIANTLAHELVHMWFGNLVTMRWWTDLWLKEGFATYIASLAVHHQFPEWNSYNLDVSDNFLSVFSLDALESSHPVSVPIGHPDEIDQIYDDISYSKGSLLLHMMNSFLGEGVLRAGVTAYLRRLMYSNAEQDDLWAALTDAATGSQVLPPGVSVKQVMDSWTLKMGYPVITVTRDGGKITLSQKRFLAIKPKSKAKAAKSKNCWWVPVTYATQSRPSFSETRASHWLSCSDQQITVNTGATANEWVILNNKGSGLYRVNYDPRTWKLICDALYGPDLALIDELNRQLLISDAMALAYVGDLPYSTAFRVLKYIQKEEAYLPWHAAFSALSDIELLLWRAEKYDKFKTVVRSLIAPLFSRLGDLRYAPTGLEATRHKLLVVKWACACQLDCAFQARNLFKQWTTSVSDSNPIPKDLRKIVYCEIVKQGGQFAWNFIWERYRYTNIAEEKRTLLLALTCTTDQKLLNELLERSLNESSGIRKQDSSNVFTTAASRSRMAFQLAQAFLEDNILRIHNYFAPDTQKLADHITAVAERLVFPEEVNKMKRFLSTHKQLLHKAQLGVQQAEERMDANLAWMAAFYDTIDTALTA